MMMLCLFLLSFLYFILVYFFYFFFLFASLFFFLFFFLFSIFFFFFFFFFSSRRRHTRLTCDWSSEVCSSDLYFCLPWKDLLDVYDKSNHYHDDIIDGYAHLNCYSFHTTLSETIKSTSIRRSNIWRSEERRVGKECKS